MLEEKIKAIVFLASILNYLLTDVLYFYVIGSSIVDKSNKGYVKGDRSPQVFSLTDQTKKNPLDISSECMKPVQRNYINGIPERKINRLKKNYTFKKFQIIVYSIIPLKLLKEGTKIHYGKALIQKLKKIVIKSLDSIKIAQTVELCDELFIINSEIIEMLKSNGIKNITLEGDRNNYFRKLTKQISENIHYKK
jgi:hypothetical protein